MMWSAQRALKQPQVRQRKTGRPSKTVSRHLLQLQKYSKNLKENENMEPNSFVPKLASEDWITSAIELRNALKFEIQGNKGFWKKLRDFQDESEVKSEITRLMINFVRDVREIDDISVDEHVNRLASDVWNLNEQFTLQLAWDFSTYLTSIEEEMLADTPVLRCLRTLLANPDIDSTTKLRASNVCQSILYSSISQGNKSNAGAVGESIVEALFASVGAIKNLHYGTQYKSKAGSDTDFVIPAVRNYQDYDVQTLIAVQFSTNDRARLVSSELKTGAVKIVFSGNGCDVSSKTLRDIGDQVIQSLMKDNVRMACYGPGLQTEIRRLEDKLKSSDARSNDATLSRLEYFRKYAMDLATFREKLSIWCR